MGWASGSIVMSEIISAVHPIVDDSALRTKIYVPIIRAFEDMDWDTQDECLGEDAAFDAALREVNPDYFDLIEDD